MCRAAYAIQTHADRAIFVQDGIIVAYVEDKANEGCVVVCDGLPVNVNVESHADAFKLIENTLHTKVKWVTPGMEYERYIITRKAN